MFILRDEPFNFAVVVRERIEHTHRPDNNGEREKPWCENEPYPKSFKLADYLPTFYIKYNNLELRGF